MNASMTTVIGAIGALACAASAAIASITGVGGAATEITAPADATFNNGALDSDTTMYAWEEQQDFSVGFEVLFDIDGASGQYDDTTMGTGGLLRGGVTIDSHFIHYDSITGTNSMPVAVTGTITFDQPIIGLMVLGPALDDSDSFGVGNDLCHLTKSRRGMERNAGCSAGTVHHLGGSSDPHRDAHGRVARRPGAGHHWRFHGG